MDSEQKRLELARLRLVSTVQHAAGMIESNGDVAYVVCARLKDPQTGKTMIGMLTNVGYHTIDGKLSPASPGMLTDLIVEAWLEGTGEEVPEMPLPNQYKH